MMYSIYTRQLMAELGKWGGFHRFNQVLVLAPRTREKHLQFWSKQWIRCLCWAVCSVWVSVRTADRQTDTATAATVEGPSLSRTADATLTFDFWLLRLWRPLWFMFMFMLLLSRLSLRCWQKPLCVTLWNNVFKHIGAELFLLLSITVQRNHCVMVSCVNIELQAIRCFRKSRKKKNNKNTEITWPP